MSKRDERAAALARANDGKDWDAMRPVERDEYQAQADREGFRDDFDPTDPSDAVGPAMRGRLDYFLALECASNNPAEQDERQVEGLDLGAEYDDHELQNEGAVVEAAEQALDEFPLTVERMATFEVVFGTGGPDDRLIVECRVVPYDAEPGYHDGPPTAPGYEIRRVLYRFTWSGSAEVELVGEDREIGEAIARRYVPELAD